MRPTLTQILERTRADLAAAPVPLRALEAAALATAVPPALEAALRRPALALIAEVKRRSPSMGEIAPGLDPPALAGAYAGAGAAAISVLTDGPWFGGSLDDLHEVSGAVGVPTLRKDFILEERQVFEARLAGASSFLLMVRALPPVRLEALLRLGRELLMEPLVEVHAPAELEVALEAGARVIGVNSRDLGDFSIDRERAWEVLGRVPPDRVAVAESGISTPVEAMAASVAGADAILVGTALSGSARPGELARALAEVPRHGR